MVLKVTVVCVARWEGVKFIHLFIRHISHSLHTDITHENRQSCTHTWTRVSGRTHTLPTKGCDSKYLPTCGGSLSVAPRINTPVWMWNNNVAHFSSCLVTACLQCWRVLLSTNLSLSAFSHFLFIFFSLKVWRPNWELRDVCFNSILSIFVSKHKLYPKTSVHLRVRAFCG